jgi:Transcriptional activator of glycolytic enzymes
MCRAVRTVKALWHEWTIGLAGNSSVGMLDSKWGSQWRAGCQSEIQWYSLRLEVIKEIRRIAQAQRISEEAAMWQVNLLQERMNCSLDQLCKQLRAGRKIAV